MDKNLADLEHVHLTAKLFGCEQPEVMDYASRWWQHAANWSFELQRRSPFRESPPDNEYVLYFNDEGEKPEFNKVDDCGDLKLCEKEFERVKPEMGDGVSLWGDNDITKITLQLAVSMDMEIDRVDIVLVRKYACHNFKLKGGISWN